MSKIQKRPITPKKIERKKIKIRPEPVIGAQVTIGGYGELLGQMRVGEVTDFSHDTVWVELRDGEGDLYEDQFDRDSGTRVNDIGCPTGWRIPTVEFYPNNQPKREVAGKTVAEPSNVKRFVRLHQESIPFSSDPDDSLYIEVWEDTEAGVRFFKAYRYPTVDEPKKNADGVVKRRKQLPTFVPFPELLRVIAEFQLDWRT